MSKSAGKNLHFQEMRGDYSTRINANGDYKHLAGSPVMYEGYLHQTQKIYESLCQLRIKERNDALTPPEKAEFERQIGLYSHRQHVLKKAAKLAKETLFVEVARGLLPLQHFAAIDQEAQRLAQAAGFHTTHIVDLKECRKKARKLKVKHIYKQLHNIKRSEAIRTVEEDFSI